MKSYLGIALVLSLLSGVAQAYPGMQPHPQVNSGSTVDKVQRLPKPYPIEAIPFQTVDGKPVDFSQYKGKVVMVNMWATWCPPCRKGICRRSITCRSSLIRMNLWCCPFLLMSKVNSRFSLS